MFETTGEKWEMYFFQLYSFCKCKFIYCLHELNLLKLSLEAISKIISPDLCHPGKQGAFVMILTDACYTKRQKKIFTIMKEDEDRKPARQSTKGHLKQNYPIQKYRLPNGLKTRHTHTYIIPMYNFD